MYCPQEAHLHESEYAARVNKYLQSHYGKTLDDLAISVQEISKGLYDHLLPNEYVDANASNWRIKMLDSARAGTSRRILALK